MVVVNLKGGDTHAAMIDEGPSVEVIFSSNDPRYGGDGTTGYDPAERSLFFERPELLILKSKGLSATWTNAKCKMQNAKVRRQRLPQFIILASPILRP